MKNLLSSSAFAFVLALQAAQAERAEPPKSAIFVIIENGGTVTNRDAALETIQYTFGEITQLRRKREYREAQVYLIFSASPTTVSWAGTPQQLYEQGPVVMDLMQFHDSCSDIKLAWEQIGLTAQITMPDEIQLISIGPVIHAAFPCDEGETVISLPQPIPQEIPIGSLAMEASLLRMLNVHPDQDEMLLKHLGDAGVMARARSGELDFDIMDAARTRAAHGKILKKER